MEYEGIQFFIKSEEFIIPDRLETDFEIETKDEFCAVMQNAKSEEETTVDANAIASPTHRSEERSQFYKVHLPLRCRLCAIPDNDMIDIFDPVETDKSIVEKIECCLPIVVKETDTLPKQACRLCLANLELCYQFHKTVVEAERQLLTFEKLTERDRNCFSFPLCDSNIEERLKRSSDTETGSNERITALEGAQTTDTNVKSNLELADLTTYPVVLCVTETFEHNNLDTEGMRSCSGANSSTDAIDSGRNSVSIIDQQSTHNSEVFGDTQSRITSLQSATGVEHQVNAAIHEQDDDVGPPYDCGFCPKTFKTKTHRTCHRKLHIGYGPYSCLYCDKKFVLLSARDEHHHVHTGERPFKCSVCGKRFAGLASLERHATVHSKTKNYPCSLCGKSYMTSLSRNSHMAIHTTEKPWQCDYCKDYFFRKGKLQNHMRYCKVRCPLPKEFL